MSIKDDPQEYESLTPAQKAAVQYWISKAIREGKEISNSSSYGIKHDYERESKQYLSNGEFKGAMRAAGHTPTDEDDQNWLFKIKVTYDKRHIPHDVSSQRRAFSQPTFRINLMGEPDEELQRLIKEIQ